MLVPLAPSMCECKTQKHDADVLKGESCCITSMYLSKPRSLRETKYSSYHNTDVDNHKQWKAMVTQVCISCDAATAYSTLDGDNVDIFRDAYATAHLRTLQQEDE